MADVAVRIRYMRLCPKVARRIQDTLLSPLHVLPSTGGYVTGRRADGSVLRLPAQDPVLLTCHYPGPQRYAAVTQGQPIAQVKSANTGEYVALQAGGS